MSEKLDCSMLLAYDKVIVYGAGIVGSNFLRRLQMLGFDRSKVIVWDARYKEIKNRCGFEVQRPAFETVACHENSIVIIALRSPSISEIKLKFVHAGYKHIVMANEVGLASQTFQIDEFINHAYRDCRYQDDMDFSHLTPAVKAIAFYLPQFHEIPENNVWWGHGFTEWTNTAKARPQFQGHYQPREPHEDFGYYDLSNADVMRRQAALAKRHGIYGWCIYYYWFSGRKLLSKPLDLLLENKDIELPFCLQWCNESWAKNWIGKDEEVLIECEYLEDDPERFIDDLKKYTDDSRYIRVEGKPLVIIYKVHNIPNIAEVAGRWRKHALEIGIGEIFLLSAIQPFTLKELGIQSYFDGETNFCPEKYAVNAMQLEDEQGAVISNNLYTYADCFESYERVIAASDHEAFLSCMCGFDNTPRYDRDYHIYDLEFTGKAFYDMVSYVREEALSHQKEFIFFFAWNEWAEGAYLEPDKRFGYAMLNIFSKAIHGLPFDIERVIKK